MRTLLRLLLLSLAPLAAYAQSCAWPPCYYNQTTLPPNFPAFYSQNYGVKSNAVYTVTCVTTVPYSCTPYTTVTTANGSPAITVSGVSFSHSDVGKLITVQHGLSGGADLPSTIQAVTDSSHITLADNATATNSAASLYLVYGNSDNAAFQRMSDAVPATGGTMMVAAGNYLMDAVTTLKSNTTLQCLPGATFYMRKGQRGNVSEHWLFVNTNHDESATAYTDSHITIRGCAFNGAAISPSTSTDAIRMVWATDLDVSDNTFYSFGSFTAFLATARSFVANNRGFNNVDGCYNNWHGDVTGSSGAGTYLTFIHNYCETHKHGYELTGTDTAQTSAGITSHVTIIDPQVVLLSSFVTGAGIWFNSGALTDTGAGVQDGQIIGGHIWTSGLGSSVGDCIKISGSGSKNNWIIGTHCDNGLISISPSDIATSYPSNNHVLGVDMNITNTLAGGAIQIKTGTTGVSNSRITGGGYAYCVDLIGATNQYAKNNSCISGTDGTAPRYHTDGTSAATALIIDTDETGASPVLAENMAVTNTVSFKAPSFFIGTTANGSLQYAGSHKIVLDADDASTGIIALRTDSGSGAVDRLTVANDGSVTTSGTLTATGAFTASTSALSPAYSVGTGANGSLSYAGSHKVVLDADDTSTGILCLRTDSGSGAQDRLCINNNGGIALGTTNVLYIAETAPTIASGFNTANRTVTATNTGAFSITVGNSTGTTTGVLTMPAATNGWACSAADVTTPATNMVQQTASGTTSVTVTNFVRTTGVAGNMTNGDIIVFHCGAF